MTEIRVTLIEGRTLDQWLVALYGRFDVHRQTTIVEGRYRQIGLYGRSITFRQRLGCLLAMYAVPLVVIPI